MIKLVKKRDGVLVPFEKQKIINAISKAGYVKDEVKEKIANEIANSNKEEISVEEIQDLVEKKLMKTSHKDVAKVYINYRYLRGMARNQYKELMDAVSEKLTAKNVQNQNANVDEHSFGGRIGEAASVVTKNYAHLS